MPPDVPLTLEQHTTQRYISNRLKKYFITTVCYLATQLAITEVLGKIELVV